MVRPKLTVSVYLADVGALVYGKFLNRTSFWGLWSSIRCKKLRISKDTQSFQGFSVELLQLINIAEFGF